MESWKSSRANSCQFDILHAPASFFLATGQNAVMDGLLGCFQYHKPSVDTVLFQLADNTIGFHTQ